MSINAQARMSEIAVASGDERQRLMDELFHEFVIEVGSREGALASTARQLSMLWSPVPMLAPGIRYNTRCRYGR